MELVYVRLARSEAMKRAVRVASRRSTRRVSMIARSPHQGYRAGCRSSFEIFPRIRFFIARSPSTEREREWANGSSIWNSSKLSRRSVLEIDVMSARTGRDTGLLYFSSTRMRSERSAVHIGSIWISRRSDTVRSKWHRGPRLRDLSHASVRQRGRRSQKRSRQIKEYCTVLYIIYRVIYYIEYL